MRVVLRAPGGATVVRDIADGRWVEPSIASRSTIGDGQWALPGLIDAHAHLASDDLSFRPGVVTDAMDRARQALGAGVTLILDKGWGDDTTIDVIDLLEPGQRPHIEAAAEIVAATGGYVEGFGRHIDPDDIATATADAARSGRGWVKLIGDWPRRGVGPVANFTGSQLQRAVNVANRAGARVAIHTMAREVPSLAVAAGVHSIEHGLFLSEQDITDLGARRGMWVPTVLRTEATLAQLGPESSGGKLFIEGLDRLRRLLVPAIEAGVHVLAGTDLVGSPADVAAEAMRLRDYGLTNAQVVAAVSTAAFEAIGSAADFAPGAPADAVLFDADPLEDLSVLEHPSVVIRLGRVI